MRDGEQIKICQKIAVDFSVDGFFICHVGAEMCFLSKAV